MIHGQMDAGAWSRGLVVGLIHDIPTVKELIDRIVSEAEQIIRGRLTGLLDGTLDTKPTRAFLRKRHDRHKTRGTLPVSGAGKVLEAALERAFLGRPRT
jgi:hypothetical protein